MWHGARQICQLKQNKDKIHNMKVISTQAKTIKRTNHYLTEISKIHYIQAQIKSKNWSFLFLA